MNRFIQNSLTAGVTALAMVASVGAVPALARSQSSEGHSRPGHEHKFVDGSGPSGASDPLVASPPSYWIWPMAAAPSDAATIDQQIRHLPAGRFNVVGLDASERNSQSSSFKLRDNEPGYLANLHRAIEHNRPLLARLEGRNVEIRNVVAAEPGGDGSVTFYVL